MAELPRVCITVTGATVEEMLGQARHAAAASRFVELRLDYLANAERSAEAVRAVRRARISCIATLRSAAAGGKFEGSAEDQLHILEKAGQAGARLVDLEIESAEHLGAQAVRSLRQSARLLLSYHDSRETPEDPTSALERLKAFPADYYKLVTMAHHHRDNAAVLGLLKKGRGRLVAFTLGEVGRPTRLICLVAGAPFTYAAPAGGGVLGVGQMSVTEMCGRYRATKISSRTKVYGVVGYPIGNSLSPAVHNAAFAYYKLNALYLPLDVEKFEDFLASRSVYRLTGFSVTMPHKQAVAQAVDRLDTLASRVGAVNTVVTRKGRWHGYNTDVAGILGPLKKRIKLKGARILVAGTGGAARAAAFGVAGAGGRVVVVSRHSERAAALAKEVGGESVERGDLAEEQFDVIVHATPLGMAPDVNGCFFSADQLNAPLIFETVHTPLETRLVKLARRQRLEVIYGLEMFLEQAAAQFQLWTGKKAPRELMEEAARSAFQPARRAS